MKKIVNAKDAACITCFVGSHAVIGENGKAVCNRCGSTNLVSRSGDGGFEPVFGGYEHTFQASKYTPKCRDRRILDVAWPKHQERRRLACG